MDSSTPNGADHSQTHQHVVVLRHGDRVDHIDPLWVSTATRPWDPPLVQDGLVRAFGTGRGFRSHLPFTFHRVFVSPFIRCIQTASEAIIALCAVDLNDDAKSSKDVTSVDKSKFKVSIEFGLCEVLNTTAIREEIVPKDGNLGFNISELETMLPAGMVYHNTEPVYKELPRWGETMEGAQSRYVDVVKALADKYPTENLLLVTHGEGVGTTFSRYKDLNAHEVDYCGYVGLRRAIFNKDEPFSAGEFEVFASNGVR